MADPKAKLYDVTLSGNILVLGSSGSGKTSLMQVAATNSMFGKLEKVHWISGIELSREREGEIESCFESEIEFYYPKDQDALSKVINNLKNLYLEKQEKNYVKKLESVIGERTVLDNLIVLDDVTGLADKSHSFVKFLTYCRKYDYNVLYIFHEPALSSKFMDIMSRTQIFCVFPTAMDLVLNYSRNL